MYFTLIGRALRQSNRRIRSNTAGAALAALLLITPYAASAQTAADFEQPPVLKVTELVPAQLLQGKGFHVEERVPTDEVVLMSSVMMESQARFVATSVRMLADYHEKKKPITAVAAPGPLIGRDQDGALILPAPVDYVSWTERVASFAQSPTFPAVPQRTLLLTGKMSPRAKKEFEALGWTLREGTHLLKDFATHEQRNLIVVN